MTEVIDRATAIEWFEGYLHNDPDEHISPNMVIDDIKDMPAVDAAPVVRCQNCKHKNTWYPVDELGVKVFVCGASGMYLVDDKDFCSYGVRIENMCFGDAINAMKAGKKVTRDSWNGKGQYVFLAADIEFHTDADISEFYGSADGVRVLPMFVLRTAQGNLQPGWLATQSDMMANDWCIVE